MIKLHEYFEKTGIMKAFFAKKINTSPATLSAWLHGKSKPKIDQALRIEKATDGFVKIKDWLKDETQPKC